MNLYNVQGLAILILVQDVVCNMANFQPITTSAMDWPSLEGTVSANPETQSKSKPSVDKESASDNAKENKENANSNSDKKKNNKTKEKKKWTPIDIPVNTGKNSSSNRKSKGNNNNASDSNARNSGGHNNENNKNNKQNNSTESRNWRDDAKDPHRSRGGASTPTHGGRIQDNKRPGSRNNQQQSQQPLSNMRNGNRNQNSSSKDSNRRMRGGNSHANRQIVSSEDKYIFTLDGVDTSNMPVSFVTPVLKPGTEHGYFYEQSNGNEFMDSKEDIIPTGKQGDRALREMVKSQM